MEIKFWIWFGSFGIHTLSNRGNGFIRNAVVLLPEISISDAAGETLGACVGIIHYDYDVITCVTRATRGDSCFVWNTFVSSHRFAFPGDAR